MTNPNVRPEIVSLLVDLDLKSSNPREWRHKDGRGLSKDEVALLLTGTPDEVQAAIDYKQRVHDYQMELLAAERESVEAHFARQQAAWERTKEIAGPYFAQLGPGATLEDIAPLLSDVERDEFLHLMGVVESQPGDVIRPDVVALATDLNPNPDVPAREWVHWDGRSMTADEADLIADITLAEVQAAGDFWQHAEGPSEG